jgi:hypothetical protein
VGDDAIRKMHYVNLTFYSKAVVRESKNISVIDDVYFAGYVGGNGVRQFKGARDVKAALAPHDGPAGKTFERSSLFVCRLAATEFGAKMKNPMSITGKFPARFSVGGQLDETDHYSSAAMMSDLFDFQSLVPHDATLKNSDPFFKTSSPVNTVCFRGAFFTTKNAVRAGNAPAERKYHPNTGHTGPTYVGVKAVRAGQNKYMLSEHQIQLELAANRN